MSRDVRATARRHSATSDRAQSACSARQRINQTSARLASLANALQADSIEGAWVISRSQANSSTLSATTSRGLAGNSVMRVVDGTGYRESKESITQPSFLRW